MARSLFSQEFDSVHQARAYSSLGRPYAALRFRETLMLHTLLSGKLVLSDAQLLDGRFFRDYLTTLQTDAYEAELFRRHVVVKARDPTSLRRSAEMFLVNEDGDPKTFYFSSISPGVASRVEKAIQTLIDGGVGDPAKLLEGSFREAGADSILSDLQRRWESWAELLGDSYEEVVTELPINRQAFAESWLQGFRNGLVVSTEIEPLRQQCQQLIEELHPRSVLHSILSEQRGLHQADSIAGEDLARLEWHLNHGYSKATATSLQADPYLLGVPGLGIGESGHGQDTGLEISAAWRRGLSEIPASKMLALLDKHSESVEAGRQEMVLGDPMRGAKRMKKALGELLEFGLPGAPAQPPPETRFTWGVIGGGLTFLVNPLLTLQGAAVGAAIGPDLETSVLRRWVRYDETRRAVVGFAEVATRVGDN